jgi:predicted SAM-dependent methyltransferase
MNPLFERLKRVEDPIVRMSLLRTMGTAHWVKKGHAARRAVVSRYLSSTEEPRLQFGAGPNGLPGWLNSDLTSGDIYLDLGHRLPLPDASFAYAFGEHVIEHITEAAGEDLMAELYRVLRPGGVLRLTTPDLKKIIAIYEGRNPRIGQDEYMRFLGEITEKEIDLPCQALNVYLRSWGHRYVYDEEDLVTKLRKQGFDPVERQEPGESPHVALRGVERHGDAEWINEAEAMCIEATRPSD